MNDDPDDGDLTNDDAWHYLMAADVMLEEAAMKFYALQCDGPEYLRSDCMVLQNAAEALSQKVQNLLDRVHEKTPLTKGDKDISHYVEENARLRSENKRLLRKQEEKEDGS